MKLGYTFTICFVILFINCSGQVINQIVTKRDTTITKNNAFSELLLDSTMLEKFIIEQKIEVSSALRLRNFYNSRNFQFAWFGRDGIEDQTLAFWNLHNNFKNLTNDSSFKNKWLHDEMELLINEDTAFNASNNNIVEAELQLTQHFFDFAKYAYEGKIDPMELQWHIPRKKIDPIAMLDSLISNKGQHTALWEPVSAQYKLMYAALRNYQGIYRSGGFKKMALVGKINYIQGDSAENILRLKKRMQAEGDYGTEDTSRIFTEELTSAVKNVQMRFGYKQNGVVDVAFIKALNVPLQKRIQQMLVNMERMRWMPKEAQGDRIVVNIPEFKMHVYGDSGKVFDVDIVVGTAANKTVVFNDILKFVVFSPYWNIPRSIVRKEILPEMRRSSNYLVNNNMEQTGFSNGLPVIRKKPGANNALGRVKFIFPNSYSIYFHGTPSKSLFDEDKRAFSHGCIRLAEPKKMAAYLLRNQPEWSNVKINAAMIASKEKWVTLNKPVPVIISYFTSWIGEDGLLNFREDIYGRDKKMAERLFINHN
ncbi:murein L,D-transpeptidase YcbB/YkuD [Pedobacter sp. AK017]|uniref:L,D-transpeptidase family protein n=1 Tax=Pedobacter sp. AK017 TaxID=2723073 RepID=UPI00161F6BD4|nr:L,D-transpeptidase family protein [Pedobacter sp. AK017]MBB5438114.1 murein L,D-transpeptidase YcbB/YkuD [Pedobacter sp. AK017]